jgi:hypothetical protein
MKNVMWAALAAVIILIAASVFYYYVVQVPHENSLRSASYRVCKARARYVYDKDWDRACQRQTSLQQQTLRKCIDGLTGKYWENAFGEQDCRKRFPVESTNDCSLPNNVAALLENDLNTEDRQCMEEAEKGLL